MPQGIGLAGGYGAGGAALGLEKIIEQQLVRQKFEELKRQAAAAEALQQQRHGLDERQFGYTQTRDTADREMRTRERSEDIADREKERGIRRSEFDVSMQAREFDQDMGRKEKATDREMRQKERAEDRAFESSERAKDRAIRAASGSNDRLVQVEGPDGGAMWVRESDAVGRPAAQATRAITGSERQALAYYNRAKEAMDTLTMGGESGQSLEDRIAGQGLIGQVRGQVAPNMMQSQDQQLYRQAQRAFTEARLRKESGAAIPQGEYDNDARTYFAQPGDSRQTIEQKRKARATVLEGLRYGSGKAYDEFYGQAPRAGGGAPSGAPRGGQQADPLGIR